MYICFAVKLINGVYIFYQLLFGILVSCFFKRLQFIMKQDLLSINKIVILYVCSCVCFVCVQLCYCVFGVLQPLEKVLEFMERLKKEGLSTDNINMLGLWAIKFDKPGETRLSQRLIWSVFGLLRLFPLGWVSGPNS